MSLVLIVTGAGVLLVTAGTRWWTVTVHRGGFPSVTHIVTGRSGAPATVGLGLLGLAAAAGILATAGLWRRAVGVVVLLAGVGATWATVVMMRPSAWMHAIGWDSGSDGLTVVAVRSAWPWVALAAALSMTAGGIAVATFGGRWPGWSGRYDVGTTPAAPVTAPMTTPEAGAAAAPEAGPVAAAGAEAPAPHEIWDALDRGEDPTASPDVTQRPDLPE